MRRGMETPYPGRAAVKPFRSIAVLLFCVFFGSAGVSRAGMLDEIFGQVEAMPWGISRASVLGAIGTQPRYDNPEMVIVSWSIANRDATANFLFDKSDALYNLAWYLDIPVTEFKLAQSFEKEMVKELTAKYGNPAYAFSSGSARDAVKAAKEAPKLARDRNRLLRDLAEKRKLGAEGEQEARAIAAKLAENAPHVFYSKTAFFDGGGVWAYTSLSCSTDGSCSLHLQFASKSRAGGAAYRPTPDKSFGYSPLDRDQDAVIRHNRAWRQEKSRPSGLLFEPPSQSASH